MEEVRVPVGNVRLPALRYLVLGGDDRVPPRARVGRVRENSPMMAVSSIQSLIGRISAGTADGNACSAGAPMLRTVSMSVTTAVTDDCPGAPRARLRPRPRSVLLVSFPPSLRRLRLHLTIEASLDATCLFWPQLPGFLPNLTVLDMYIQATQPGVFEHFGCWLEAVRNNLHTVTLACSVHHGLSFNNVADWIAACTGPRTTFPMVTVWTYLSGTLGAEQRR
jgi:hypothetical protein